MLASPRIRPVGSSSRPPRPSPRTPGSMFGAQPKIDRAAAPLPAGRSAHLRHASGNRVIAQGNVEIYYNNYILTADQVIYDQSINTLIAEGNAQLKDPNGSITRADRFEALDDFRDAFVQSLSVVTQDDTRIAAERATRREGNINEYETAASSRLVRTTPACRRCGASAPRASSTTSRRPPSPTRTRSSSCSACRCCTCPISSTPTRRSNAARASWRRAIRQLLDARHVGRGPLLLRARPQLRFDLASALLQQARRALAG